MLTEVNKENREIETANYIYAAKSLVFRRKKRNILEVLPISIYGLLKVESH